MKFLFILFCFLLSGNSFAEGCNSPYVRINTSGPSCLSQIGYIGSLNAPLLTDYTIKITGNMTCSALIKQVKLYKDGVLLLTIDTLSYFLTHKLKSFPGKYRIWVDLETIRFLPTYCDWTYDIVDNPTSISSETKDASSIMCFPNPTKEKILVTSHSREITSIELFDVSGTKLVDLTCRDFTLELPLENYPPGIYFLHVAILGEQTTIKKIVIQ